MAYNLNLHAAKRGKKDEFYTQLTDIENELYHYRGLIKNLRGWRLKNMKHMQITSSLGLNASL